MVIRIEIDEKDGKYIPCDFCGGKRSVDDEDDIEAQVKAEGWIEYDDQNLCSGCVVRISDIRRDEELKYLIRGVLREDLRPIVRRLMKEEIEKMKTE